jgi:uncharacterized protein DUF1569
MRTLQSAVDRQSITERISALTSSDRRLWGKMSVDQMVCHLCDSYRSVLGEKPVSPVGGFAQRTIVKFIALRLPMKWPRGVRTRPEVEQGVGGTPPGEFDKDRAELLSAIDRFCGNAMDLSIAHPIFGRMTKQEWLRWGYLHADHHLRQFGR